jgi:hypothetical protein
MNRDPESHSGQRAENYDNRLEITIMTAPGPA